MIVNNIILGSLFKILGKGIVDEKCLYAKSFRIKLLIIT